MKLPIPTKIDILRRRDVPARAKIAPNVKPHFETQTDADPSVAYSDAEMIGRLTFNTSVRLQSDRMKLDPMEKVSEQMARQMHHYVYGPVTDELRELRALLDADGFTSRDPVFQRVNAMIEELEGNARMGGQ